MPWLTSVKIAPGDRAPDFTLPDQQGEPVNLASVLRERPVVLYFYPKDDTRICTAEACAFRDSYSTLVSAGADVLGVSCDSVRAHSRFAQRHGLQFRLLSDRGGTVWRLYGGSLFGRLPGLNLAGRVTFVIGQDGVVQNVFHAPYSAQAHVDWAFDTVRKLLAGEQVAQRVPRGGGDTG